MKEKLETQLKSLYALKNELYKLLSDSTDSNDVVRKLFEVAKSNTDLSDISSVILVMQSNISTESQKLKERIIELFNRQIDEKILLYEALIQMQSAKPKEDKSVKVPILGNIAVNEVVKYLIMIFFILMVSFIVNAEATQKALEGIKMFISYVEVVNVWVV